MFARRISSNKFRQFFPYANKMNTVNYCSNSIKHGLKYLLKCDITFKTGDIMLEIATPFNSTQPKHFSYLTTLFHLYKIVEITATSQSNYLVCVSEILSK